MLYVTTYYFIKKNLDNCKNNGKYYLPIINCNDVELKNGILIYLKSSQKNNRVGFYGYTNINNIIDKRNNVIYNNLLEKYCLSDIYNLNFAECNCIYKFDRIFKIKEYNNISNKNIKIPKSDIFNVFNFNLANEIINTIKCNEIKEKYEEINCKDNEKSSENNEDNEDNKKNDNDEIKILEMKIPILYIPCEQLIKKMETLKIKKNTIKNHKEVCTKCELINNNNNEINFNNNATYCCMSNIDDIIFSYQNVKKYTISEKHFKENNFDIDVNNFIFYNDTNNDHYYNNCIFILPK